MASSSNPNTHNKMLSPSTSRPYDPTSTPNTTFVQADPSTFRDVVQRLTGATHDPSAHKLPVTSPARFAGKTTSGEMGPRRPAFKLHERRQSARKLEIQLNNGAGSFGLGSDSCPSTRQRSFLGFGGEMLMVSPVSPLDLFMRGSPRTPRSPSEEEDRAIAEKGFYLHPSPLSTPRGSEPELLPLFPLHSPRDDSSSS
ncbi:VQ motif-containing protein 11-like [Cornus florida]|uniref:VQ motif-containing protein 11-like n=1 Tax=Cornus florida TaxID=4283 RepID=UPI0028A0BD43|nr:VQ motif-containing protein 11-like [Cornus florida]